MNVIDILINSYHGLVWKLFLFILLPIMIIDFAVHRLPWFTKGVKKLIVWLVFLGWLVAVIKNGFLRLS